MILNKKVIDDKIKFINEYKNAINPAEGSAVDSNANVTQKTIASLEAELYKDFSIQLNREMMVRRLKELYGEQLAEEYIEDITSHLIYVHDETSMKPYCASISLYPFLLEGTKCIGGVSTAPKNLQSFNGSLVNFIYQVASNFAGAVATVEYLMYFDWFARKDYGDTYLETHWKEIKQELQGVVYAMNQPASARGDQSVFWNISIFDKYYFEAMFGEFYFPDGSKPKWDSLNKLQDYFMAFFRKERKRAVLTFPVVTVAMLTEGDEPKDKTFANKCSIEMSKGNSFFVYMSDNADSLSSCCRLRNELVDNEFSYTLGAGGISTGSFEVITINFNRLMQSDETLSNLVERVHKYLVAYRSLILEDINKGLLPAYTAGLISLDKQFGTIGLNGVLEGYEYLATNGSTMSYDKYLCDMLGSIKWMNTQAHNKYGFRFNTEFVPAENLGVKNAKWDKKDGLYVSRDCYNSYFYPVEDTSISILDKVEMYRKEIVDNLDGGSALHLNLEHLPSVEQANTLFKIMATKGVNYWTFNVLSTICDNCGTIDPNTLPACKSCGNTELDYGTRIIGYLKRISSFSKARQEEAGLRYYTRIKNSK